jgi:hypothetical protein
MSEGPFVPLALTRRAQNVPGDFSVDANYCTFCSVPWQLRGAKLRP